MASGISIHTQTGSAGRAASSSEASGSASIFPQGGTPVERDSDEDRFIGGTNATGNIRRVACDVCRERKVRCDRRQPQCGRCGRLGHICRYTTSKRQSASKLDISEVLLTLNARLVQAEAQLALAQSATEPRQDIGFWTGSDASTTEFDLNRLNVENQASTYSATSGPNMEVLGDLDLNNPMFKPGLPDWSQFAMDGMLNQNIEPVNQVDFTQLLDPPLPEIPPSLQTDTISDADGAFPPPILFALHQAYFDWMDYILPMVRRDRFFAALESSPLNPQVSSLSNAIAMLGASLSSEYAHLEEECYHRSRKYLEITERHENEANFLSIDALQACVLITWYEFKGKSFARAWMSLGRAIRLAKMLGLHQMDRGDTVTLGSGFQLPFPATEGQAELEERRRTFWALFIYDAYASARTGSPMTLIISEISTALPSAELFPEPNRSTAMPSLKNAATVSRTGLLSSFAGTVLMVSLYCRCLQHFRASHEQDNSNDMSYGFWLHHYQLDQEVTNCSTRLLGHVNSYARPDDPMALALSMNFCAVTISLHEAAIAKARNGNLPATLIIESENRCLAAAMEIVGIVQLSHQLDPSKLRQQGKIYKATNTFLMWPLAMAAQVLSGHVKHPKDDFRDNMALLQLLRFTMEDLKDPSGHWNSVIRDIASQVDQTSSNVAKKRKQSRAFHESER